MSVGVDPAGAIAPAAGHNRSAGLLIDEYAGREGELTLIRSAGWAALVIDLLHRCSTVSRVSARRFIPLR